MPAALLVLSTTGFTAVAQDFRYITVPEVEVRSGPSQKFYATNRLQQGDKVKVVKGKKDSAGWLAIEPPRGSFSWINAKDIKKQGQKYGAVTGSAPVAVRPGTNVPGSPPANVESAKVKPGTLVVVLDKAYTTESGSWIPIQPPVNEVRYIPADAVKPQQFAGNQQPNTRTPRSLPSELQSNPLIAEADRALEDGQIDRAKQLYKNASEKTEDHKQRIYCYNRLISLESGPSSQPGHPSRVATHQTGQLVGQRTTLYRSSRQQAQPAAWSAYGVLRETAFKHEEQPVYVLENRDGRVLSYVAASPGFSLQGFVGRTMSLYGPTVYHSDAALRSGVLIASHLALP